MAHGLLAALALYNAVYCCMALTATSPEEIVITPTGSLVRREGLLESSRPAKPSFGSYVIDAAGQIVSAASAQIVPMQADAGPREYTSIAEPVHLAVVEDHRDTAASPGSGGSRIALGSMPVLGVAPQVSDAHSPNGTSQQQLLPILAATSGYNPQTVAPILAPVQAVVQVVPAASGTAVASTATKGAAPAAALPAVTPAAAAASVAETPATGAPVAVNPAPAPAVVPAAPATPAAAPAAGPVVATPATAPAATTATAPVAAIPATAPAATTATLPVAATPATAPAATTAAAPVVATPATAPAATTAASPAAAAAAPVASTPSTAAPVAATSAVAAPAPAVVVPSPPAIVPAAATVVAPPATTPVVIAGSTNASPAVLNATPTLTAAPSPTPNVTTVAAKGTGNTTAVDTKSAKATPLASNRTESSNQSSTTGLSPPATRIKSTKVSVLACVGFTAVFLGSVYYFFFFLTKQAHTELRLSSSSVSEEVPLNAATMRGDDYPPQLTQQQRQHAGAGAEGAKAGGDTDASIRRSYGGRRQNTARPADQEQTF